MRTSKITSGKLFIFIPLIKTIPDVDWRTLFSVASFGARIPVPPDKSFALFFIRVIRRTRLADDIAPIAKYKCIFIRNISVRYREKY